MVEREDDYFESKDPRLAKREKANKRRRNQELADLDWVLSDPRGRRYIMRICNETQRGRVTCVNQNSNWMSRNAGVQEHSDMILNEVKDNRVEMFLKMQAEHYLTPKENTDE
jgi:hypothetical protein